MQGAQVGSLFGELEPTCSRIWHNRIQQQQQSQASPSYRKALATEEVLVALNPYMSVNPHISPLYFWGKWADGKFTNVLLTVRISLSPLYSRAASHRDYSIAAVHFHVVPAHSIEPFIRLPSFSPVTRL